jgi:beta-phosphoglucomutase-like phosphatase (HAD superfamily)
MKFSALIFDFNGVLWWDTEIQESAWQETAKILR